MARLPRFIIPGSPHHITQRGNGRAQTFFSADDYALYRDRLKTHCAAYGVSIWAWVLMPNHVHMILVPEHQDSLRAALSKVHRAYAGHIHAREKRTGDFWQGRFGCVAMDYAHLMAAIRYVVLKPVGAQLVKTERHWAHSSVHAHFDPAKGDGVTDTAPVAALHRAESIGRPLGDGAFMDRVMAATGRDPRPDKRGPRTHDS